MGICDDNRSTSSILPNGCCQLTDDSDCDDTSSVSSDGGCQLTDNIDCDDTVSCGSSTCLGILGSSRKTPEDQETTVASHVDHNDRGTGVSSSNPIAVSVSFWPKALGDTTYKYNDLDNNGSEVRLLRILPGSLSNIECELFHANLSNTPEYVAISYAWGDPEDTLCILVNGHDFPITASLWQALCRIRSCDMAVIVWADAICINQSDIRERNHQVHKMTNIYASAHSVAVWLGPDEDDSNLAMDLILELLSADNSPGGCELIIRNLERKVHFKSLASLLERSYWTRLWTVQELMSARHVEFYCGSYNKILPISAFLKLQSILHQHEFLIVEHLLGVFTKPYYPTTDTLCSYFLPSLLSSRNAKVSLDMALVCTRDHKCQDARDKIYGVLGLIKPEYRSQIRVDYNLPKRTVYLEAVQHILNTTQTLDIICRSTYGCCLSHLTEPGFPTWLPDFSLATVACVYSFGSFDASRSTHAIASISLRKRELEMHAVHLDTVWDKGNFHPKARNSEESLMILIQWRSLIIQHYRFDVRTHHRFCRILRDDRIVAPSVSDQDWMEDVYYSMNDIQRELLPEVMIDERLGSLLCNPTRSERSSHIVFDLITVRMQSKRFCITRTGLFILAGGRAVGGDVIYIALGCFIPLLLRKRGMHYELVGDVFVEGYMRGLAIDELEQGWRRLENIVLV